MVREVWDFWLYFIFDFWVRVVVVVEVKKCEGFLFIVLSSDFDVLFNVEGGGVVVVVVGVEVVINFIVDQNFPSIRYTSVSSIKLIIPVVTKLGNPCGVPITIIDSP